MTPAVQFARSHQTAFVQYEECVKLGRADEIDAKTQSELIAHIKGLGPWRKGPFEIFGNKIQAHWKSEIKWNHALAAIAGEIDLKNKRVCDVGCNNGYYLFRMIEAGASHVVGIDPVAQFRDQFDFIRAFHPDDRIEFRSHGFEDFVESAGGQFDVLFCMGVLYHQKNPFALFDSLRHALVRGGVVVLETIALDIGDHILVPSGKYAGAGGIWTIPGSEAVINMFKRAGYSKPRLLRKWDARDEQQRSEFADLPGMKDFYDATGMRTVEGYPVPMRHLFIASK